MQSTLERAIVDRGTAVSDGTAAPELRTTPLLAALRRTGTQHVYADTADVEEIASELALEGGALPRELDGSTANQPLVRKVVERYLERGDVRAWARELEAQEPGLARDELLPLLYAIVCARVGNDMTRGPGAGRDWEVSLQLHMGLGARPDAARWIGRLLRRMVPGALVKVPFAPDAPECLLVARDLEREGVPVNLTSTFSARQVVVAAMVAGATRTNVFMGRLNQGLQAELLGEHVDLEAQRALRRLRQEDAVPSHLIVASLREWRTFVRVAGCDVFTAPCEALRDFLRQEEVAPDDLRSQLDTSYEDRLGISEDVLARLGPERIARLYRVEPELIELLRELRHVAPPDGDALRRRFEEGGFGDLFHDPDEGDRRELEQGKLPDLDGALVERVPLDTHYSLLANADFARHQAAIDAAFAGRLAE